MKFSNQKISLDNHRKKEEYGGNSDHHEVDDICQEGTKVKF